MRHPSDGTLRRLLDEPDGVADADRAHVAHCPRCLATLAAIRDDASAVGAALTAPAAVDLDSGWDRLSAGLAAAPAGRAAAIPRQVAAPVATRSRWGAWLRSPAVVIAGVVLLLTGAGVAAAADWLPIFRTEQIAPVTISADDLVTLPDLSAYGQVTVVAEPGVHQVADSAAAAAATGLDVPEVGALPTGIGGQPEILAGGQAVVEFTFDAAKAAAAVAPATLPTPPPGLDGATFRLVAGPGVAQVWSSDSGVTGLLVARAIAPTGYSSGVSFTTARDYLTSIPGLPDDVVAQLRAFSGDGSTLPLPLPADKVTSEPADVDGVPAQLLTSTDGTMTAVVWVQNGIVTAVGGSIGADEALDVARGLG